MTEQQENDICKVLSLRSDILAHKLNIYGKSAKEIQCRLKSWPDMLEAGTEVERLFMSAIEAGDLANVGEHDIMPVLLGAMEELQAALRKAKGESHE